MTGTTIAQALPIAAAPILTRIYTPEEFGVFAFYFAVVSILAVMATGRYELAIVLPRRKSHAFQLVALSSLISLLISLFFVLIIWLFQDKINNLLGKPELSSWLYFIPLSIFLTGLYQSFYYWFNREKNYNVMAKSRVVQSGMMVTSLVIFGWFSKVAGMGLVIGQVIGQVFSVLFMARRFVEDTKKITNQTKLSNWFWLNDM
jgi:O-antigen/teichoic acid export membrane protein